MVLNSVKQKIKSNLILIWLDCDYDSQIKFFFPDWQKKKDFFDRIIVDEIPPAILNYAPIPWI